MLSVCQYSEVTGMCYLFVGIAKQLDADATSMVLDSCAGTLNYMSPEVLQGLGSKDIHSKVTPV